MSFVAQCTVRYLFVEDNLGKVQKKVKEKGFPGIYQKLTGKDCLSLNLVDLEGYRKTLGIEKISKRLEWIEKDLGSLKLDCTKVSGDEVLYEVGKSASEIGETALRCIEQSEEKINGLNKKLGKLVALIDSHKEYRLIADEVTEILGQCLEEMLGDLTEDAVKRLELATNQLDIRKRELLESKGRYHEAHFSNIHYEESVAIDLQFSLIRSGLEEAKKTLRLGLGPRIGELLTKLDAFCDEPAHVAARDIQKAFLALPSALRKLIFAKAGIVLDETNDRTGHSMPGNGLLAPKLKRKVRSASMPMKMESLVSHPEPVKSEPKKGHSAHIAHLLSDPVVMRSAVIAALEEFPGGYSSIVQKRYEKKAPEKEPATIFEDMQRTYSKCEINSLIDLRRHVKLVSANTKWKKEDMRVMVQLLLDGAERGGVALRGKESVYVWVRRLAQGSGRWYGSENAAKDVGRLLLAIDKAIGS